MATSPDLVGYRSVLGPEAAESGLPRRNSVTPPDMAKKSAKELLDHVSARLNDAYRAVHLLPTAQTPLGKHAYQQRVSFDTINLQYADDDPLLELSDDEFPYPHRRRFLNENDLRGRGRDRDFLSAKSPPHSPSASPTRLLSPIRGMDMAAFFARNQVRYPTTPIVTRRGCTLTRLHKKFEPLYLGQLLKKGLCPVLPGRVILIYISGRTHTWVALDWVLRKFVQHGDTVIIVASLPHALGPPATRLSQYPSPQRYTPVTDRVRQRQRNRPEFIKQVTANVMDYALTVVNPNTIVKITVEIAEGKTKDVLKDMYKLYEPNIVVTGSKVNSRNSAPLKLWLSLRLSDRLVKNFPLPVIVVPALNMSHFEEELSERISGDMSLSSSKATGLSSALSSNSSSPKAVDNADNESLSDELVRSDSSADSESSVESYTSFEEIAELYNEYRDDLHDKLDRLRQEQYDENYFSNFAKTISDRSLAFCEELRLVDPDFRGNGALLARAITGSNSFGAVPYKTKSLLAPVEKPVSPTTLNPAMSYSEVKRNLKLNAEKARQSNPSIQISLVSPSVSPTSTPKPTALKFADDKKPKREKREKTTPLKKYLSHDESLSRKVEIQPSKSHPDIRTVLGDAQEKKKKKSKKFWKLF